MAFPLNPELVSVQESWYEKLNRWEEALEAYERKYQNTAGTPAYVDAALGRLRRDPFPSCDVGMMILSLQVLARAYY